MALSVREFLATFIIAVYVYYYEDVDPRKKPIDTLPNRLLPVYDFIVVGAGSAGCVVANRLSENPDWNILLIEAGGDENAISDAPYLSQYVLNTTLDWNYTTVEQKRACRALNGMCQYPRGRGLGGSSTVNGMMYVRGNKADYDEWAYYGNEHWSSQSVLPYFMKMEDASSVYHKDSFLRGHHGPLNVQYSNFHTPLKELYLMAGEEFGLHKVDYNGIKQEGIGVMQATMRGRSRESTAKAYLNPIRHRMNLHITKHAEVTRLDINEPESKINGVWFERDGMRYYIGASKEVIISAGTINTPKLLMLSGIGPRNHLLQVGIRTVKDLPVGKNLQDHLLTPLYFSVDKPITITYSMLYNNKTIIKYVKFGEGPLTTFGYEAMAFFNVFPIDYPPNMQLIFGASDSQFGPQTDNCTVTILSINIQPFSRGSVRLRSKDPRDPPLIDPNYFGEDVDFIVARLGLKALIQFMQMPTMKAIGARLNTDQQPNCAPYKYNLDMFIDCVLIQYSQTIFHPIGTAKMGPKYDANSVVDSNLLVHGFNNLRVIDASIMPSIPRGNTNAPTIMIGEKGSDIIKLSKSRTLTRHRKVYFKLDSSLLVKVR